MSEYFFLIPQGTLFAMMLALGMELRPADFARLLRQPLPVGIGMSGQLLLLPLIAFALVSLFPMPLATATGLLLIAACPGGATSNMFTRFAGGDTALSISLTAASSLLAPFTIPLVMLTGMRVLSGESLSLAVSATEMVVTLLGNTLVPVLLGMYWHYRNSASSARYRGYILGTSTVILVLLLIGLAVGTASQQPDIAGMFLRSTLSVVLLLLLTSAFAVLACSIARLNVRHTLTLLLEIGTQNVNLALVMALTLLQQPALLGPTLVYLPFMLLFIAVVICYGRRTLPR